MVKNPPANAGDIRDVDSIPGLGRSPGGGHGNLLQYSCLESPVDRGAWQATVVHGLPSPRVGYDRATDKCNFRGLGFVPVGIYEKLYILRDRFEAQRHSFSLVEWTSGCPLATLESRSEKQASLRVQMEAAEEEEGSAVL